MGRDPHSRRLWGCEECGIKEVRFLDEFIDRRNLRNHDGGGAERALGQMSGVEGEGAQRQIVGKQA